MNNVASILLPAMVVAACSAPAEFADWTLPIPEEVRIVEHVVTPLEARDGPAVVFEEDLVLGSDGADPDLTFYGLPYFAVDDDGRVMPWIWEMTGFSCSMPMVST